MKNINTKDILKQLAAAIKAAGRHASFLGILVVLIAYIIVVTRISGMATAEPSASASVAAQTSIPRVDQSAIKQIQSLEQSNTDVHSLFNQARNNPFQE